MLNSLDYLALRNAVIVRFKCLFYREILVIGDSHALVFLSKQFKLAFTDYFFTVIAVAGATVSGLSNPKSKTQALPIFYRNINKTTAKTAIVLLGEVDVGFVIWYRTQKYNKTLSEMFEKAVLNYQNLLDEIAKKSKIICISTPLPTVSDQKKVGDVAKARNSVNATQKQRTELTLRFNEVMREYCSLEGYAYISLDDQSLGEDGLVDADLLNSQLQNHHYNRDKYAEMIIAGLKGIL